MCLRRSGRAGRRFSSLWAKLSRQIGQQVLQELRKERKYVLN